MKDLLAFSREAARSRFSADEARDAVEIVRGQLPVMAGGSGVSISGAGGSVVATPARRNYVDYRICKIVNRPDGASEGITDYTDERYYVTSQGAKPGEFDDRLVLSNDAASRPDSFTLTVTNLAEWKAGGGTHLLATDGSQYALVFCIADAYGFERYVMHVAAGIDETLSVTAITALAGSKYTARRLLPPVADVALVGDASAANTGVADTVDVLLVDANEVGRDHSSHLLAIGQDVRATPIHTNADGTRVYLTMSAPADGETFNVAVTMDGGDAGDAASDCDFTYTVNAISNGTEIGTTVAVNWARDPHTKKTAGTKGIAHYEGPTLVLDSVDEVDDVTTECAGA